MESGVRSDRPSVSASQTSLPLPSKVPCHSLAPVAEKPLRAGDGIEAVHREFTTEIVTGREQFLAKLTAYLAPFAPRLEIAEFKIVSIQQSPDQSLRASIRYDLVGTTQDKTREGRIGHWSTQWSRDEKILADKSLRKRQKQKPLPGRAKQSSSTSPPKPWDRPTPTRNNSAMVPTIGEPFWTARSASMFTATTGSQPVISTTAGFDSLYICQPAGLPNSLYRNRGDGNFEDVTDTAGVGVPTTRLVPYLPTSKTKDSRTCW